MRSQFWREGGAPSDGRSAERAAVLEFLARDGDAGRCDDELVVALLDDVAVDLAGDLLEFVDDALDGAVADPQARDVGDDEVAVVDCVLDRDDVLLVGDLRDVDGHSRLAAGGLEVLVEVQFHVVVGGVGGTPAHELAHDAHTRPLAADQLVSSSDEGVRR